jgi:hypothetical protein
VALVVPAKNLSATLPAHGRYRGDFAVRLEHWEVVGGLPLRAGAALQDESYRFTIAQVETGMGQEIAVRAREWRATSSFDRKPMITYAFYMRNAAHSRAIEGRETEPFEGASFLPFWLPFTAGAGPSRFLLRGALVSFQPSYSPQEPKFDWDPAWYADAEVVILRITDSGAVLRTLDIPDVSLVQKR